MQITMLKNHRATEDGFTIRQFLKGLSYDLREHLALTLVASGIAKPLAAAAKKPKNRKKD